MNTAYLYWIHLKEHNDPLTQGYIGLSNNYKERWNQHKRCANHGKKKDVVHLAMINYGIENIEFTLICKTTREHASYLEGKFRPSASIGWNILKGGDSVGRVGLPQTDFQKLRISEIFKDKRLSDNALKSAASANANRIRTDAEICKRSNSILNKHLLDLHNTNYDVLSRTVDIYHQYLLGNKQYATAIALDIPYRGMKALFKRFENGYIPTDDERMLEFIKDYVNKYGIYKSNSETISQKRTQLPVGVFLNNKGSYVAYMTVNKKRHSKVFSVNEYGDQCLTEAIKYRKQLEIILVENTG